MAFNLAKNILFENIYYTNHKYISEIRVVTFTVIPYFMGF